MLNLCVYPRAALDMCINWTMNKTDAVDSRLLFNHSCESARNTRTGLILSTLVGAASFYAGASLGALTENHSVSLLTGYTLGATAFLGAEYLNESSSDIKAGQSMGTIKDNNTKYNHTKIQAIQDTRTKMYVVGAAILPVAYAALEGYHYFNKA